MKAFSVISLVFGLGLGAFIAARGIFYPEDLRRAVPDVTVNTVDRSTGELLATPRSTQQPIKVRLAALTLAGGGPDALAAAIEGKTVALDCLYIISGVSPCYVRLAGRDVGLDLARRGLAVWSDADLRVQDSVMQRQYKAAASR